MEKIEALEDAINKKSLVGIYSVFYTIAHGDPNFSTRKFRDVLEYVKNKNIDGFIQAFDGEEFEEEEMWNEEYWALIASSLIDNFCMERIDHLESVGKKVYSNKVIENAVSSQGSDQDKERINCNTRCNEEARSNHSDIFSKKRITEEKKNELKSEHKERIIRQIRKFERFIDKYWN